MASASYTSNRPTSGSPRPSRSLSTSVACKQPDHAGQNAEHARLGAVRREIGRRRLREQAAVAGTGARVEDRHLPLEAHHAAVHERLPRATRTGRSSGSGSGTCRCRRARRRSRRGSRARSRPRASPGACARRRRDSERASRAAATSTFGSPTSRVVYRTCRCRFEASTRSKSTRPIRPTPAAARYSAAGEPSPPAPTRTTLDASSFSCPSAPTPSRNRCRL